MNAFNQFQLLLDKAADIAFFPISADLQYLTGIPRYLPNYGAMMHPGAWIEGAWLTVDRDPILLLSRMTAEFGGLKNLDGIDIRVLGDWDDPIKMVASILDDFNLPKKPTIAISDKTEGGTVVELNKLIPGSTFISATDILRSMRVIKSDDEIAKMRQAGAITEAAYSAVLKQLKYGMLELDVVSELDFQLRRHGSLGPSFATSLYSSGPHHRLLFDNREETWRRQLQPPVALLFDFGAIYEGMCYDFGRTVFFGVPTTAFREIYALVMQSQAAGIAACKAGEMTSSQADAAARRVIVEGGYGPEFRHRLGHGIGMDVHEPPFLTANDNTPLREGMLVTIEPSITRFNTFSARVEDVVIVREGGGEPITSGFRELHVI